MAKSKSRKVQQSVEELAKGILTIREQLSAMVARHEKEQKEVDRGISRQQEELKKRILSGDSLGDVVDDFIFLQTNQINSPVREFFLRLRQFSEEYADSFVLLKESFPKQERFSSPGDPLTPRDFRTFHCFYFGLLAKDAFEIDLLKDLVLLRLINGAKLSDKDGETDDIKIITFSAENFYSILCRALITNEKNRLEFFDKEAPALSFNGPRIEPFGGQSFDLVFGAEKIFETVSRHILKPLAKAMEIEVDFENKKFLAHQLNLI